MEELDDKQSELTKTELKLLKVKNQEDRMNGLLTEYQNKLDQIKELRTRIQRDMFKLSEQGNERDEIDHKLQKTKNVYLEKS
jgi:DNA repair ATPase RecN